MFIVSVFAIENYQYEYTPGIYDDKIAVKNVVADIVYLEIEQDVGNRAYDWISFVPKSKTKIIEEFDGSEDVKIRWKIPTDAEVGDYNVNIEAYNQDNKLLRQYELKLSVENRLWSSMRTFLSREVDFHFFKLNYVSILLLFGGIVGLFILLIQIKRMLFG